ncbi:peptidase [Rosenbergiella collisarenosi]|uniref:S24 family peptidase n=1 Tax=Rosenbergiella collisarenosi TaxID=1544695 RepID=UPI001BDB21AF|nr:S24 family peptidase [Rosenbergiella collisarenosi]MBT0722538.1 peptidase [Rosenbergiella collisarenosi]
MAFPSPAQNYAENRLDLNAILKLSAHSHYFMICEGNYPLAGIIKGALLIIDRSLDPVDGSTVIAEIDGGFEVRRLLLSPPTLLSLQENKESIKLAVNEPLPVWGVISYVINDLALSGFNTVCDPPS